MTIAELQPRGDERRFPNNVNNDGELVSGKGTFWIYAGKTLLTNIGIRPINQLGMYLGEFLSISDCTREKVLGETNEDL